MEMSPMDTFPMMKLRRSERWHSAKLEWSLQMLTDIECPQIDVQYKYGGVDKKRFFNVPLPSVDKWPVQVISHFVAFGLSNSWLEYIRNGSKEQ